MSKSKTAEIYVLNGGIKTIKNVFFTHEEKRISKLASKKMGFDSVEEFYQKSVLWYLDQYKQFNFHFGKATNSMCTSVWFNPYTADKLKQVWKETGIESTHFIYTAVILYLEINGYYKGVFSIDWPGRVK